MKTLVCVKQVPEFDPEAELKIGGEGQLVFDHLTAFRMNRVDENAVEEALLIKKAHPDVTIDILTVGPDDTTAVVRRGMGMGANAGIHLRTGSDQYHPASQIAQWIEAVVKDRAYDLILTGIMSEDRMQGQVGPMLAERLNLPCATSVVAEEIDPEKGVVTVEREIEGGYRDVLQLTLPAVLTIQSGINTPRYPSLSNVMRAKRAKLEVIETDTLTPSPSAIQTALDFPKKTRSATVLEGNPTEKAEQLYSLLQEKAIIP